MLLEKLSTAAGNSMAQTFYARLAECAASTPDQRQLGKNGSGGKTTINSAVVRYVWRRNARGSNTQSNFLCCFVGSTYTAR